MWGNEYFTHGYPNILLMLECLQFVARLAFYCILTHLAFPFTHICENYDQVLGLCVFGPLMSATRT